MRDPKEEPRQTRLPLPVDTNGSKESLEEIWVRVSMFINEYSKLV